MKKILVVDDDIDILTLIKMTLTLHEYDTEVLSQWQTMDDLIEEFMPDIILLNVSFGGANGRDICRRLKSQRDTQHIPVILFSANLEMGKNLEDCNAQTFI